MIGKQDQMKNGFGTETRTTTVTTHLQSPRVLTRGMRFFSFLLLSTFQSSCRAQSCPAQQTPSDALGPFYLQNSPLSSKVGPASLLADPLQRLELTGRVLSSTNCELGISNITVEVWYAGEADEFGNSYQDDNYRGQVVTDSCGRYSFVQTFPALYASRPILHDHFRLSRSDEQVLVTQMYFEGTGEGYVADADSRKMQVVQVDQDAEGVRSVEFNMYVDLEGDASCDGGETADVESPIETGTGNQVNDGTTTSDTSDVTLSMPPVYLFAMLVFFWDLFLI